MFSPHERVYTTPDVSVPAAEALLQQLRLERILKRFGYFACYKPIGTRDDSVAPPLGTLGPPSPTRYVRPFGAHEAFTGWQRSNHIQIPKPTVCKECRPSKSRHSAQNAPRPKRPTTTKCNNGEVQLEKHERKEVPRADLFKPFQPIKSPQRLPKLHHGRKKGASIVCPDFSVQDKEITRHIEITQKKKGGKLKKLPTKIRKKKKGKLETEFVKWEADTEEYIANSVSDLHDYVSKKGKGHEQEHAEQKYREQIETHIRRGVHQRVEHFGHSAKQFAKNKHHLDFVPVLEIEFQPSKDIPKDVSRR